MIPVVAWSLAVYSGTAAALLWLANRWVQPISRRVALLLAAVPLLWTGRAVLTGGVYAPLDILYQGEPFASRLAMGLPRTPLLSDVVSQMIPFQHAVRDSLEHGRVPLWNRFLLSGEPLLAVQQPAALHPMTWLGLLLPPPQAWTFQMTVRMFVALLSAFLFMREIGSRNASSLIGATAWGLSDFAIFWLAYPVGVAISLFPFLVLGLGRLARDADRRALALTVTALVLIVAAGHPETLLFAVAAGGICFLFQLRLALPDRRLRAVGLSLASGALALGLTAPLLLPLIEALPQTFEHALRSGWGAHLPKSVGLAASARRAMVMVLPFAYGVSGRGTPYGDFGSPALYAGSILFPLAWTGAFSRHRWRGLLILLGLLGAALWVRLLVLTDAIAKLPLFDIAVLDYFVFLGIFALAALAALGSDRLRDGDGFRSFLWGAALAALAITGPFLFRERKMARLGMEPAFLYGRLAAELVPLLVAAIVVAVAARRRWPGARTTAALLGILIVARVAESSALYPTLPAETFYPRLPVLDAVPRGGEPFRVVGLGTALVPNSATLYDLEDVRGSESMVLGRYRATYPLWCRPLPASYNIVEDLRAPFLSFLNVRYAIVGSGDPPPPGWIRRASTPGGDLLENGAVLPRAFVPATIRPVPDGPAAVEAMRPITDFAREGIVEAGTHEPAGPAVRNGVANVRIASYRSASLVLAIEAEEPAVVATSVTAWRGWKARLDGAVAEPLIYNHAFLGFRVPAGKHRLELRYVPDSFRIGVILSVVTLLIAAALVFRRPKRAAA